MAIKNPKIPESAYLEGATLIQPSSGSRLFEDDAGCILLGQPPEVLKGLILHGVNKFDTLVLPDIKEKGGSLTNSLEFPLYFFLFVSGGLEEGRRLNLVGEKTDISHALRLLRITLLGPTRRELDGWMTEADLRDEWLTACEELALKDKNGETIKVEDFFNIMPFVEGLVKVGEHLITHVDKDVFDISIDGTATRVDLNDDTHIDPPPIT